MGPRTADVYTPEQQARPGVDEHRYREVLQPLPPDRVQGREFTFKDLETNQNEQAILVGMTFYSVHDVDPQKQCFSAELTVKLWWWEKDKEKWQEALDDWKDDRVRRFYDEDGRKKNSLKQFKVPMLDFFNHRDIADVGKPFCEVRKAWPSGLVLYEHRVRGTFNEVFELAHFPYDVQALTVQLRVKEKKDTGMGRYFALNAEKDSHALKPRLQHNVKSCEWRLYKPSALAGKYDETTEEFLIYEAYICLWRRHECMSSRRTRDQLPCYCLAPFCALRPAAFLTRTAFTCHPFVPPFHTPDFTWNVLAVMGMISTLSLGVFGVPASDGDCLATRSSIVLTLLLTAIAFKFVFADALPKVSYQTVLDGYMNTCFFFLAAVFVENALISRFGDIGDAETIDNWFALTYIVLWLLANAVFVAVVRVYVLRVSRILGEPLNEESEVRSPLEVQGVSMPWPHKFLESLSRSSRSGKEEMKETYWYGDASKSSTGSEMPRIAFTNLKAELERANEAQATADEQLKSLQREVDLLKKGTLSFNRDRPSTPTHADGGDTDASSPAMRPPMSEGEALLSHRLDQAQRQLAIVAQVNAAERDLQLALQMGAGSTSAGSPLGASRSSPDVPTRARQPGFASPPASVAVYKI